MADLLKEYEYMFESIRVIPSDGGRFEVTVNDKLLYSKLSTNRHVEPGEVNRLVRKYLQENS